MIRLKCPQCGRTATAPEAVVRTGEWCYRCNIALQIADPEVAAHRAQAYSVRRAGVVLGALCGAVGIPLLGIYGGESGLALAGAFAGALLGAVLGLVKGLFDGVDCYTTDGEKSWITNWVKALAALGAVGGWCLGMYADLDDGLGQGLLLLVSGLAGLVLGGLWGAFLGARLGGPLPVEAPTEPDPVEPAPESAEDSASDPTAAAS